MQLLSWGAVPVIFGVEATATYTNASSGSFNKSLIHSMYFAEFKVAPGKVHSSLRFLQSGEASELCSTMKEATDPGSEAKLQ